MLAVICESHVKTRNPASGQQARSLQEYCSVTRNTWEFVKNRWGRKKLPQLLTGSTKAGGFTEQVEGR